MRSQAVRRISAAEFPSPRDRRATVRWCSEHRCNYFDFDWNGGICGQSWMQTEVLLPHMLLIKGGFVTTEVHREGKLVDEGRFIIHLGDRRSMMPAQFDCRLQTVLRQPLEEITGNRFLPDDIIILRGVHDGVYARSRTCRERGEERIWNVAEKASVAA